MKKLTFFILFFISTNSHALNLIMLKFIPIDNLHYDKLENHCSHIKNAKDREKCGKEKPQIIKEWKLKTYEKPTEKSTYIGDILIRFYRDEDFAFRYFWKEKGKKEVEFYTDGPSGDWSYGYYKHTFLDLKNGWLKLPKNPFPKEVWFDAVSIFFFSRKNSSLKDVTIRKGATFEIKAKVTGFHEKTGEKRIFEKGEMIYFGKVEEDHIYIRNELKADALPCDPGNLTKEDREAVEKAPLYKVDKKEFFDKDMHLILDSSSSARGC